MADTIKDKDLELWRRWKATRSQADLQALMDQMKGPRTNQVNRWASIAPRFLLDNQSKALALQAFETYDPNHAGGAALATHVMTYLQKLSRTAYERQATVSVPEHKRLLYNRVNQMKMRLEEDLGHPPTIEHLADHMGMSPPKLRSLMDEVGQREYMESEEHPDVENNFNEEQRIAAIVHDLTPVQQKIFKWKTGYDNTTIRNNAAIMKEMGLTQGQLSYQLTVIRQLIDRARK
jgi:AraC-like DNA-binding protein